MYTSKVKLLGVFLALGLITNPTNIAISQGINDCYSTIQVSADEITPYSSNIISYNNGLLSTTSYGTSFTLCSQGNATVTIEIQKKVLGIWFEYDDTRTTTTFNNVTNYTWTLPYSLTRSGTYRCKYTITGTVNGDTETVTDYSGTIII